MISKIKPVEDGGSRIAIVFNNLLFEFYLSRLFNEFRTGTGIAESERVRGEGD